LGDPSLRYQALPFLVALRLTGCQYRIKAIPTIAIFKDGSPVEIITGLTSRTKLEKSIKGDLDGSPATQPFLVGN